MNGSFSSNVSDDNDEDDSPVSATRPREEYHELAALINRYLPNSQCVPDNFPK